MRTGRAATKRGCCGSRKRFSMRDRQKILDNLESLYRDAFARAQESDDAEAMARLDFEFQREQLQLEVAR